MALAFLCEAYDEEVIDEAKNDVRVVLHLHPALAPYKAAILPLSKKLAEPARKIYQDLCSDFMLDYDDTGSIGKRYRREDEIGTPYCITVDFATVGDDKTPADNCRHHPRARLHGAGPRSHQRAEELAGRAHQILIQPN